jgi:hypothetical protein
MKALTIWQPWATLIAAGVKRIETRSWSTDYRGPLAIHAAARPPEPGLHLGPWWVEGGFTKDGSDWELRTIGAVEAGVALSTRFDDRLAHRLPLGAVVATCRLVDVVPILTKDDHPWPDGTALHLMEGKVYLILAMDDRAEKVEFSLPEQEVAFGDYSRGRYGWLLTDVEPVVPPALVKGRQGLWEWDGRILRSVPRP